MEEIIEKIRSDRSNAATSRAQQASKLCWQLAVAGFVVVWLFKEEAKASSLTPFLFTAIILFAIAVLIQVGYYILSAITMRNYAWTKLAIKNEEGEFVPNPISKNTINFLWRIWLSSFIFALFGYIMLGIVFYRILCG